MSLDVPDYQGNTTVIEAVSRENMNALKVLVEAGADVNVSNKRGQTPLTMAVACDLPDAIRTLVGAGADVHAKHGDDNDTLLAKAAVDGSVNALEVLLELGVEPDVANELGLTPVHAAAYAGCVDALEALADVGAALDTLASEGRTPASLAAEGAERWNADGRGHKAVLKFLQSREVELTEAEIAVMNAESEAEEDEEDDQTDEEEAVEEEDEEEDDEEEDDEENGVGSGTGPRAPAVDDEGDPPRRSKRQRTAR